MGRFFCMSCGKEVDAESDACPSCGKLFRAVRCPKCSFTGEGELFIDGCPNCSYGGKPVETLPVKEKGSSKSDSWFDRLSRKMLLLLLIPAMGVLFFLIYLLIRLA